MVPFKTGHFANFCVEKDNKVFKGNYVKGMVKCHGVISPQELEENSGISKGIFKAIGGSGVKKTCQAYFEELFAVLSTLFTEYQNSTPFRRYDRFNFRGF